MIAFFVTLTLAGTVLVVERIVSKAGLGVQRTYEDIQSHQSEGYELRWGVGSELAALDIDSEGERCDVIEASEYLYTACVLATNKDAELIASQAFGRINREPTPALEAVIWRAVLDGDASICDRGGLAGANARECKEAVRLGARESTDEGITVAVSQPSS